MTNNSMILAKDTVAAYFAATNALLTEIKQQRKSMCPKSETLIQLQNIIGYLSTPSDEADKIRVAYLELSSKIESELTHLHGQGLYPDLYRNGPSQFNLMEYIVQMHKDILMSNGNFAPDFTLTGTSHVWRYNGLLSFAMDQQVYLRSTKFNNLWDAVQCYEMQRYLLAQLFEYLNLSDNL